MLFHELETICSLGAFSAQISVTKRCDCMFTGRYESRTRRTAP